MYNEIIDKVRTQLEENIDEKTQASSQRFFKEALRSYGVKIPIVNQISTRIYKELRGLEKDQIFKVCEILWQSGYLEESFVASRWTYSLRSKFEPGDFAIFKRWIDTYIDNWASCDTFCNHTMGEFLELYPEYLSDLKVFTHSENRWMRRASAVSLVVPARKGLFTDIIFEISDCLIHDKDDLVQKGFGWLLKEASRHHQQMVFDYVMSKKSIMPRTAFRYAIEKMPSDMKTRAMIKP